MLIEKINSIFAWISVFLIVFMLASYVATNVIDA